MNNAETQERILEGLAYIGLWDLTLSVTVDYALLILFGETDILFPLKMLIIFGFLYWSTNSFASVYLHYSENGFDSPISLSLKIISSVTSVITVMYAIPSAFKMGSWISIAQLDTPTLIASLVGMFAIIVGLIFLTLRAFEL